MKLFGPKPWGNWSEKVIVATPVDAPCQLCEELIAASDMGVLLPYDHAVDGVPVTDERPWHRDCLIYSILGEPVDERATPRESACAARLRVDQKAAARPARALAWADGLVVIHSAPSDLSLCGIDPRANILVLMVGYTPADDVLGDNEAGCPACIDAFEKSGGKSRWRRAKT